MKMQRPAVALGAAALLAVVSLAANLQSQTELAEQGTPPGLVARHVLSLLMNGALWPILMIFAGWAVTTWWRSIVHAIICGELALSLHYGLGWAIGFFTWAGVLDNLHWFIAAVAFGIPLGLIGWLARRPDGWGLLARLSIPVGMVVEPFVMGMVFPSPWLRPAISMANRIAGGVELALALVIFVMVVRLRRCRTARDC